MRPGRHDGLGLVQVVVQFLEAFVVQPVDDLWEKVVFLFAHMMADLLDEHRDLGVETLVGRLHLLQVGQEPLQAEMLFQRLQDHRLCRRGCLQRRRIEEQLLDLRLRTQLSGDLRCDLRFRGERAVPRALELPEEFLD